LSSLLPTPLQTLERTHNIGRGEELDFVYLGNVLGHRYENTCYPGCGELLIRRCWEGGCCNEMLCKLFFDRCSGSLA
jgi:hypothetical protein